MASKKISDKDKETLSESSIELGSVGGKVDEYETATIATTVQDIALVDGFDRNTFIQQDVLVQSTEKGSSPIQVLRLLRAAVAEEQASLLFQRRKLDAMGKDSTNISIKRIEALAKMANIEIDLQKIKAQALNPDDPRLGLVVQLFVNKVKTAALDSLHPEQIDVFFNKFSAETKSWSDEVGDLFKLDEAEAKAYLEKMSDSDGVSSDKKTNSKRIVKSSNKK